tara:strand:+ start:1797 stop:2663 length:867 start_codon:yes stop_codon:yes gene_type:complete
VKNYKIISLFTLVIFSIVVISCEPEEDNDNNGNSNNMGYNCSNSNGCVAASGGQYITLEDCLSVCESSSGNESSWNCINNNCIEYSNTNGTYSSLSECESNCQESQNCNNSFDIGQNTYTIGGISELINFGNFYNNSTVNYELRLFSNEISTTGSGNYSGTGNMIYLNLHTNGSVAGNYSFNNNGFNPNQNTFDGGYFTNVNMYNYSMGMVFPTAANSGNVEIIDNGSGNFDVTYSFNGTGGVNGCFSGEVTLYQGGGGSGSGSGSGSGGSAPTNNYNKTQIKNPLTF